jgi:CelD/BcsL family acetyltransferase involved in cellulose biosynthesis
MIDQHVESVKIKELNFHTISLISEMEALRDSWNYLAKENLASTPFQLWEWNYGLVKFEGKKVKPQIIVAKNKEGEIIGIAPFWLRSFGFSAFKVLEFIGTGKSDYLDFLFLEPYKEIFIQNLLKQIEKNKEWRIIDFKGLRQETADIISQYGPFIKSPYDVCLSARLPDKLQEYELTVMQKRLRKSVRHRRKKLDNEGKQLTFSLSNGNQKLLEDLQILFYLHQSRQQAKGERGRFIDKRWREIFSEVSSALFQSGNLKIGVLTIDGQPAACNYALLLRDKEYIYMSGINTNVAWYSPGSVLEHWMIGQAIEKGKSVYDFLRGNDTYKSKWTNEICQLYQIVRGRTNFEILFWLKWEVFRNSIYRSVWIKKIYNATIGRFR